MGRNNKSRGYSIHRYRKIKTKLVVPEKPIMYKELNYLHKKCKYSIDQLMSLFLTRSGLTEKQFRYACTTNYSKETMKSALEQLLYNTDKKRTDRTKAKANSVVILLLSAGWLPSQIARKSDVDYCDVLLAIDSMILLGLGPSIESGSYLITR